jgi:hypothetical protein
MTFMRLYFIDYAMHGHSHEKKTKKGRRWFPAAPVSSPYEKCPVDQLPETPPGVPPEARQLRLAIP